MNNIKINSKLLLSLFCLSCFWEAKIEVNDKYLKIQRILIRDENYIFLELVTNFYDF